MLVEVLKIIIHKCCSFIDESDEYVATPDRMNDDRTIVEFKCPSSARYMSPEEAIAKRNIIFWKVDRTLKFNHNWYYKVGQLQSIKCESCIFAAWTPMD